MDESWRMRMGMPSSGAAASSSTKKPLSRRRSTDEMSHRKSSENPLLEAEDFNDVFGGPPRTVISRQFSGNECFPMSSTSSSFYVDVFQPKENLGSAALPARGRRSLPEFGGPAEKGPWRSDRFEGFYSDVFGWKDDEAKRSRTRSRSKTSSSSVVSSEELSPLGPATGAGDFGEDDVLLLASKLRSINVPRRVHSNRPIQEDIHLGYQGIPTSSTNFPPSSLEYESIDTLIKSSHHGFHPRHPSPEDTNSPSSVVSSLWHDNEVPMCRIQNQTLQEQGAVQGEVEAMRSYWMQHDANRGREEMDEAIGVEEAIAWAKEKFQAHCTAEELYPNQFSSDQNDGNETTYPAEDGESDNWSSAEEKQQTDNSMELEMLNEKIRLWSSGNEADIRLLLSTLHHILWPESGWVAVRLTSLIESHHVKKAYQRARLFLHPDKLLQRGATILQKYVAEKAFPILQDAWAAFVSQDESSK